MHASCPGVIALTFVIGICKPSLADDDVHPNQVAPTIQCQSELTCHRLRYSVVKTASGEEGKEKEEGVGLEEE